MNQYRNINDECGVFGIYGVEDAASLTYYGLHALQHRGQEGCGIVSVDQESEFHRIKGKGLVTEVFKGDELQSMQGKMAIGHV
ncbi:MAG: amidophosphoribosyltransferase, partial [Alistipes sp.]|nr:amidophosphoribosyltransferase [Alistipes sp.]